MKSLKTILVVLDKPKHPQSGLDKALQIAAKTGAHLHLTSFCWHAMCEHSEVFDVHQRRSMKKEILRAREEWLWQLIRDRKLNAADITVEVVWARDIADWVSCEVVKRNHDLVVKSVHRSDQLLHMPLDWQLLRSVPVPVLLAGVTSSGRRPALGKDVLATVDLRHNDRKHRTLNLRVLDAAARFAEISDGKMHCVAVVEYSKVLSELDMIGARRIRKDVIEKTQDLLSAMLEPYGVAKSRIHRPAGKVGQMVAETARKTKAGLVVVGSSAKGKGLLGGSAEKILERVPGDLLVVHP
jgi:universal stress protein E